MGPAMHMRIAGAPWLGALLLALLAFEPACAQEAAEKPLLSEVIRAVVEKEGIAAARSRFDEIVPARIDEVRPDPPGFTRLGTEYVNRGDWETAQALFLMGQEAQIASMDPESRKALDAVQEMLAEAEAEDQANRAARQEEEAAPPDARRPDAGPVRDDLARFYGLYGIPGDTRPAPRRLFVSERCGYLLVGAEWGDVAPWQMRSVGETAFTQAWVSSSREQAADVQFRTRADGSAEGLSHTFPFLESPLVRVGDLPPGWEPECPEP